MERSATAGVLGQQVRALRIRKRLSQERLAELADVHRTFIGRIERGETNLTLTNVVRLAEALDVPLRVLLEPLESLVGKSRNR